MIPAQQRAPHVLSAKQRLIAQAAVIAVVAIYGITNGFIMPLLALRLEEGGLSGALIGFVAAVSAAGTLLVSPAVPHVLARIGTVRVIACALLADVALILALPVFTGVIAWVVIRFFMGATVAGLYIASEMWISELAEDHSRARLMAVYNAVMSVSFGVGPLIIVLTGTHGWTPFVTAAVVVFAAALPLPFAARYAPSLVADAQAGLLDMVKRAPTLVMGVLLVATLFGAAWALMPVYGIRLGMSENGAATLLTMVAAGGVVLQFPIGWLGDRFDRYAVLFGCAAVSVVAMALVPLSTGFPLLMGAILFVWGGAFVAMYTMAMAIGGDRFKGVALAALMAVFGVMWGVGSIIGPLAGGWAMDIARPHGVVYFMAGVSGLWLVAALARRRALPR